MVLPQILIVGASVRAAAWSARRAGFAPYSLDLFADADTAAVGTAVRIAPYPGGLAEALRAAPAAPWMYTGLLENDPPWVEGLAQLRPLWGNGGSVLRGVRDPFQLARAVREAGCNFPEIGRKLSPSASDWLRKPLRSGGGMGIWPAAPNEMEAAPTEYFQRFIAGTPASALYVATAGRARCLGMTRQLVGRAWGAAAPFQYAGSIAPFGLLPEQIARIAALGNALASEFGLRGLFGVDFILGADGDLWILEVNPRYTAAVEVVERWSGLSLFAWHVAAVTGKEIAEADQLQPSPAFHGKAIVYAPTAIRVPSAWDGLVAARNSSSTLPQLADLPRVGTEIGPGEPICTVFASGSSDAEVEGRLREQIAQVIHFMTEQSQKH